MPEDSKELLDRYRHGDDVAADALYQRYADRLLTLARSRLSRQLARRIDAEDVVQSAYRSFFIHARHGEFTADCEGDLWRCWQRSRYTSFGDRQNIIARQNVRRSARPVDRPPTRSLSSRSPIEILHSPTSSWLPMNCVGSWPKWSQSSGRPCNSGCKICPPAKLPRRSHDRSAAFAAGLPTPGNC